MMLDEHSSQNEFKENNLNVATFKRESSYQQEDSHEENLIQGNHNGLRYRKKIVQGG
jgi:hypothetical protein